MKHTSYYFMSSARQGLAGEINTVGVPAKAKRTSVDVKLEVAARNISTGQDDSPAKPVTQSVELYGPGDILGFDPRIIIRHDPKPDVGDFEPNYFPAIEFADPDFLWRFTAKKAGSEGLIPWLTLIVLVSESRGDDIVPEFEEIPRKDDKLPPAISIINKTNNSSLPKLADSWCWAHVQTCDEEGKTDKQLVDLLTDEPERAICRLMCARRLMPQTRYDAFIVPTFELGVLAGLGKTFPDDVTALSLAWNSRSKDIELPYYYRWQFRTGMRGDFEHLVRLLEKRTLKNLGLRDMNCASPGFGVAGVQRTVETDDEANILQVEGALQSLDTEYTAWGNDAVIEQSDFPDATQMDIAKLINRNDVESKLKSIDCELNEITGISEIKITVNSSGSSLDISWISENAVSARLEYWLDGEEIDTISANKNNNLFNVTLGNLIPTKKYNFDIIVDLDGDTQIKATGCSFTIPLPTVTPPIYGRWHYGQINPTTNTVIDADNQDAWIDQLNLDPRHRVAAGMGAQVIRKQQEALMSSAWDQLGAIESANDLLRRNQFARDTSSFLYDRFNKLNTEDYLRFTSPMQKLIMTTAGVSNKPKTVSNMLATDTRIPLATLDPALRRIMRPRGPIRNRQKASRFKSKMLSRIAAGTLEIITKDAKPSGTLNFCKISQKLEDELPSIPDSSVTVTASPTSVNEGEKVTLVWDGVNVVKCELSWNPVITSVKGSDIIENVKFPGRLERYNDGHRLNHDGWHYRLVPGNSMIYSVTCEAKGSNIKVRNDVVITRKQTEQNSSSLEFPGNSIDFNTNQISNRFTNLKFCDGEFTCNDITDIPNIPNAKSIFDDLSTTLCDWLDQKPLQNKLPPIKNSAFLSTVKNNIHTAINPEKTLLDRTKKRLKLSGSLIERFSDDYQNDPLDSIMWSPEFPQPMYDPLRELSQEHILPGVEKIPQNTIGLLKANRRFVESYLCGINHEFSKELLWRGFPTDQRATCFRQFWDVDEYIPPQGQLDTLFSDWKKLQNNNGITDLDDLGDHRKTLLTRSDRIELIVPVLSQNQQEELANEIAKLSKNFNAPRSAKENQRLIIKNNEIKKVIEKLSNTQLNKALTDVIKLEELDEWLKDITPLTKWNNNDLGSNNVRDEEKRDNNGLGSNNVKDKGMLVLVIRGDLLKRYPNAQIYAVDAVKIDESGKTVPGLPEYLSTEDTEGIKKIYPVFKATLPSDLTFFGFPFTADDAVTTDNNDGKYFIVEEQVTEARFGMDLPTETKPELSTWDDLSWSHFGYGITKEDQNYGKYLNNAFLDENSQPANSQSKTWDENTSSATNAWITFQKPVRIAVHANDMIPEDRK